MQISKLKKKGENTFQQRRAHCNGFWWLQRTLKFFLSGNVFPNANPKLWERSKYQDRFTSRTLMAENLPNSKIQVKIWGKLPPKQKLNFGQWKGPALVPNAVHWPAAQWWQAGGGCMSGSVTPPLPKLYRGQPLAWENKFHAGPEAPIGPRIQDKLQTKQAMI